jgi:hypothetical protein
VKNHVGEYRDLTPEYAKEVEEAFQRVLNGATYEDLMRA